jgi:hypothetical protein
MPEMESKSALPAHLGTAYGAAYAANIQKLGIPITNHMNTSIPGCTANTRPTGIGLSLLFGGMVNCYALPYRNLLNRKRMPVDLKLSKKDQHQSTIGFKTLLPSSSSENLPKKEPGPSRINHRGRLPATRATILVVPVRKAF